MEQFRKLIYFNYFQIKNCFLSIISFSIFLILQPLILLVLHFINVKILDYSLIVILVPLLFSFIFISILCFRMFSENKTNNLEILLTSQPIPKYYIYFSRVVIICILLGIQIVFNNLFNSIMLLIIHNSTLLYVLLISNSFITFFIELCFIAIAVLMSLKIKPNWYLISVFLLAIITCGISLVTRPFIKNNGLELSYNNNKDIQFTKIINNDETYYGVNLLNNNYLNVNITQLINSPNIGNYFIPSEWLITYYNNLFNNFYKDSYSTSCYSLNNYELVEVNKNNLYFSNNNTIFIRPNDINLFSLNNLNGSELLFNTINEVFLKNNFDTNAQKVELDLLEIKKCYDYNLLNTNYIELLKDLLGINQEFSCLFYYVKYYYFLNNVFTEFKKLIIQNYNQQTLDFLDYIFSSDQTKFNLFLKSDNILNTKNSLNFYYPEFNEIVQNQPILNVDKEFIIKNLIRFEPNLDPNNVKVRILLKSNDSIKQPVYSEPILLKSLKLDPSIIDSKTYEAFINTISLRYDNTKEFLNTLINNSIPLINPNQSIFNFILNNNAVSANQFDFIAKLQTQSFLIGSEIIITITCLLFLFLMYLSFSLYKESNI